MGSCEFNTPDCQRTVIGPLIKPITLKLFSLMFALDLIKVVLNKIRAFLTQWSTDDQVPLVDIVERLFFSTTALSCVPKVWLLSPTAPQVFRRLTLHFYTVLSFMPFKKC